jgi:hypothetical protein
MGVELLKVIGIEALFGKKFVFGEKEHWVFEYFFGFGFRNQSRDVTVYQEASSGSTKLHPVTPYEEVGNYLVPTLQFGLKFGFSFQLLLE